jgi:hypothetical protein
MTASNQGILALLVYFLSCYFPKRVWLTRYRSREKAIAWPVSSRSSDLCFFFTTVTLPPPLPPLRRLRSLLLWPARRLTAPPCRRPPPVVPPSSISNGCRTTRQSRPLIRGAAASDNLPAGDVAVLLPLHHAARLASHSAQSESPTPPFLTADGLRARLPHDPSLALVSVPTNSRLLSVDCVRVA